MKVKVLGWNYEGAAFRGIPSDTDEVILELTIECSCELKVTQYILEEFSYGEDTDYNTMSKLAAGYKAFDISNGDGCGGVVRITVDDVVVFEDTEYLDDFVAEATPVDLYINLDQDTTTVNDLVRQAYENGVIPDSVIHDE